MSKLIIQKWHVLVLVKQYFRLYLLFIKLHIFAIVLFLVEDGWWYYPGKT